MLPPTWTALTARLTALALVLTLHASALPEPDPHATLAAELRELYAPARGPGERWRRRASVRLPDGRQLPRSLAYRDDPEFVAAATWLLASPAADDAPLGAWLLGTAPASRRAEAEPVLLRALEHSDERVAFEAAQALAAAGSEASLAPLARSADAAASADVRTAAAWVAREVERRTGASGEGRGLDWPRAATAPPGLAPGFRRGVSWWMSEGRDDAGAASFARVASLGVTWVSLHTWDPLQRALDDPVLAEPRGRHGFRDLAALVRNAHAAGLRVMVKPHLEMRGHSGDHNRVAMRSARDWERWFEGYAAWLLRYAREAQQAGADMLCVGRELDATVLAREGDWRRLIARMRREFRGPLTYSANFDTWPGIGFWDALDFVGVSAYFPLSDRAEPSLDELEAGFERALAPLAAAARRFGRPVLLTEAGFPSIPGASRAPWREERATADVWLQARCYEATLRALARQPAVEGVFFWLWERTSDPPFRDQSHAIIGKPASFTMARHYLRGQVSNSESRRTR